MIAGTTAAMWRPQVGYTTSGWLVGQLFCDSLSFTCPCVPFPVRIRGLVFLSEVLWLLYASIYSCSGQCRVCLLCFQLSYFRRILWLLFASMYSYFCPLSLFTALLCFQLSYFRRILWLLFASMYSYFVQCRFYLLCFQLSCFRRILWLLFASMHSYFVHYRFCLLCYEARISCNTLYDT